MTRDEIVTALRCVAVCGGCDCTECESRHIGSGTCVLDQDEYFSAAADLIENQQRHIEALMKANDSLKDAIARRDKQIAVRCRECKHCDQENHHCDHHMGTAAPLRRKPDDFCSYGERKDDEHEH